MKIGFFQFEPLFGEVRENLEKVVFALRDAEADLMVLPELAFTGYHFKDRSELLSLAEDPGTSLTVDRLCGLCRERDFFLATGFAERAGDRVFNAALLIRPDGRIHRYRKIHLFDREKECFDPGDDPPDTLEIRGVRIGLMICFDWAFPETARTLALKGADILCHPSNLVLPVCQQAMRTRCFENGVFSITANRFGKDVRPHGEIAFTGGSQVVSPSGEVLYRAGADRQELFITEIDPVLARNKSITDRNDRFKDRRPEFYRILCDKNG